MICHVGQCLPREGAQERRVMLSEPFKAALPIGLAPRNPGKLANGRRRALQPHTAYAESTGKVSAEPGDEKWRAEGALMRAFAGA
jgi:hypothetical protein